MSTKQNIPEHIRWYVVGAHLAGAVDSQIMEMTDLTKGSIRQIIQNFKRTGSPSISRLAPPEGDNYYYTRIDPYYAVIAETLDNNTALDTDQDHKSKRRRVTSRKTYTATHVVQHILDESQQSKPNNSKPSSQSNSTAPSTKSSSPSSSTKTPKITKMNKISKTTKPKEWTRQDDLILLQHAWTRFPRAGPRWYEVETKLEGRHSAKECEDRWNVVRPILMKTIERYGTEGW